MTLIIAVILYTDEYTIGSDDSLEAQIALWSRLQLAGSEGYPACGSLSRPMARGLSSLWHPVPGCGVRHCAHRRVTA